MACLSGDTTYEKYGYLTDPHTAVGIHVYERYRAAAGEEGTGVATGAGAGTEAAAKAGSGTGDGRQTIVAATASPFKFNRSVVEAVWGPEAAQGKSEFALLAFLAQKTRLPVPPGLKDLDKKPVRHSLVVEPAEMAKAVRRILSR